MKNFICTSEGFVMSFSHHYDKSDGEHVNVIHYTNKVREAMSFSTKNGNKFMEKYGVKGFIWKPFLEDPLRDKYVVRKNGKYGHSFGRNDEEENEVEAWVVEKAFMAKESDVRFLTTKNKENQNVMEFDVARAKAVELNRELMQKLRNKSDNVRLSIKPTE